MGDTFDQNDPKTLVTNANSVAEQWAGGTKVKGLEIGQQFGRYRVIKRIGQGGMGLVYLAHDTTLDREIALKIPLLDTTNDADALRRFYREARAAAKISHPNICSVHDVGEIDGTHFLSMAYLNGKPLSKLISIIRKLTERKIAKLVLKLAQALETAHQQSIAHRDLKPSNIIITSAGEPIIMDFGLARRVDTTDDRLTKTGVIIGTPVYMCPEQMQGKAEIPVHLGDVYSLGIIFYEMLTGRVPFEGSLAEILYQSALADPVPPRQYRKNLDPVLQKICLTAMHRDYNERYASMAELADDLSAFLKDQSSGEVQAPNFTAGETSVAHDSSQQTAKSLLIDQRRDRLIELAKRQTEQGLPEKATQTLRQAIELCPKDEQISQMLEESENRAKLVSIAISEKIPKLEEAKRFDELFRCLTELQQLGVKVKGIDTYIERTQQRLERVREKADLASQFFQRKDYKQAREMAARVLKRVADHPEALKIAEAAKHAEATRDEASPELTKAVANKRYREAQRIRQRLISEGLENEVDAELVESIETGLVRLDNYKRSLLWLVVGGLCWLVAGFATGLFATGIAAATESAPLFGFAALDAQFVATSLTVAAHLAVAAIFASGLKLTITRRFTGMGGLGVVAFSAALILAAGLAGFGLTSISVTLPIIGNANVSAYLSFAIYGMAVAALLTNLMKGVVKCEKLTPPRNGYIFGGLLAVLAFASIDAIPVALQQGMVASTIAGGILVATGVAQFTLRLMLIVVVGVFAGGLVQGAAVAGLATGAGVANIAIMATTLTVGGLTVARRINKQSVLFSAIAAIFAAALTVATNELSLAPEFAVLAATWFPLAAAVIWANRHHIHFEFQR